MTRVQQRVHDLFALNPKNVSPKGWMMTRKACPWCGKDGEHFGIKFQPRTQRYNNEVTFHCFKCDVSGGEFLLFRQMDMLSFLRQGDYIKQDKSLEKKISLYAKPIAVELDISAPTKSKPIGFRRVTSNKYLESRGFEPWQFDRYTIGTTIIQPKLRDRVIFLIMEDGENKGYVARTQMTHNEISDYESRTGQKVLRYLNEPGVDFARLLGGIDEIDAHTTTAMLVEGITDKANIDRLLNRLKMSREVKCLCTFGKKISEEQVEKIRRRGIMKVVFLYDPDAVSESKTLSMRVKSLFDVSVGFLKDKDPGDLTEEEFKNVFKNVESPIQFFVNKVQKRSL